MSYARLFSHREDLVHLSNRWTASESHVFVLSSNYKTHRNCRPPIPPCTYTVISVELISPGNADAIRSDRRMRIAPAAAPAGDKRKVNASDHRVTPNAIIGTLYIMPNRLTEYLETRSSVVTLVGCAFHKHQPRAREGCPRSSFYRSVQEGCARLEAAQQGRLGRWWRRGRGLARRLHRLQRTPLFFVLV